MFEEEKELICLLRLCIKNIRSQIYDNSLFWVFFIDFLEFLVFLFGYFLVNILISKNNILISASKFIMGDNCDKS